MAIVVKAASYGTLTAGFDVTERVQEMLNLGNDDIPVNNDSMGGDPDVGKQKQFGIVYILPNGEVMARACIEGDTLDLVHP